VEWNAGGGRGVKLELSEDGFALPEVGPWARRKYHYLGRYLDAFTTSMRKKWPAIHYIDLFAAAGLARIKGSSEIVMTSGALAASVTHPFTGLHLCDKEPANVAALQHRLKDAKQLRVVSGDANLVVDELIRPIPRRGALCVTFADPFGLHLDFETVKKIAAIQSDLVILLADNMDALRNWSTYYAANPDSNLDRFMGEPGWRNVLASTASDKQAQALRERYQERLRTACGYEHFAHERVQNASGRDIYILLYASRHPTGLKIWHGVSKIDEGGQRKLF
jgi:three-Cys-motif partner protein